MVIMPSAPVIFSITFLFEREVVEHPANMVMTCRYDPGQVVILVGRDVSFGKLIDLFR